MPWKQLYRQVKPWADAEPFALPESLKEVQSLYSIIRPIESDPQSLMPLPKPLNDWGECHNQVESLFELTIGPNDRPRFGPSRQAGIDFLVTHLFNRLPADLHHLSWFLDHRDRRLVLSRFVEVCRGILWLTRLNAEHLNALLDGNPPLRSDLDHRRFITAYVEHWRGRAQQSFEEIRSRLAAEITKHRDRLLNEAEANKKRQLLSQLFDGYVAESSVPQPNPYHGGEGADLPADEVLQEASDTKPEEPDPQPPGPTFLNLVVDIPNRQVSRRGVDHIPVMLTAAPWAMFYAVYLGGANRGHPRRCKARPKRRRDRSGQPRDHQEPPEQCTWTFPGGSGEQGMAIGRRMNTIAKMQSHSRSCNMAVPISRG